eukprot:gene21260-28180_t
MCNGPAGPLEDLEAKAAADAAAKAAAEAAGEPLVVDDGKKKGKKGKKAKGKKGKKGKLEPEAAGEPLFEDDGKKKGKKGKRAKGKKGKLEPEAAGEPLFEDDGKKKGKKGKRATARRASWSQKRVTNPSLYDGKKKGKKGKRAKGQKGQKGKLEPGMAEAQTYSSAVLRLISLSEEWREPWHGKGSDLQQCVVAPHLSLRGVARTPGMAEAQTYSSAVLRPISLSEEWREPLVMAGAIR